MKRFENLEIEYRYYPLEKIGGDFFSIKQLGRDHVSVLIGDVVGHGVSAALFLSLVNSATQRISKKHGQHPEKYLSELNKILFEEMPSYFITAIYGIFSFNQDNGTVAFTFSNGGHPYPILYRADSRSLCQLNRSSTIIGSFEDVVYEKTEIILSKGDRLFMMTDGIIEVENENKEIIGFDESSWSFSGFVT
jgi:sigma-B regulation protein RsbU (phosphoserine phosphatase)